VEASEQARIAAAADLAGSAADCVFWARRDAKKAAGRKMAPKFLICRDPWKFSVVAPFKYQRFNGCSRAIFVSFWLVFAQKGRF
jgi:hypothetical protein